MNFERLKRAAATDGAARRALWHEALRRQYPEILVELVTYEALEDPAFGAQLGRQMLPTIDDKLQLEWLFGVANLASDFQLACLIARKHENYDSWKRALRRELIRIRTKLRYTAERPEVLMDAGYVFAPYVTLLITNTFGMENEDFSDVVMKIVLAVGFATNPFHISPDADPHVRTFIDELLKAGVLQAPALFGDGLELGPNIPIPDLIHCVECFDDWQCSVCDATGVDDMGDEDENELIEVPCSTCDGEHIRTLGPDGNGDFMTLVCDHCEDGTMQLFQCFVCNGSKACHACCG